MDQAERVLFVHAHPDDESISTGGTIALLVDAGSAVTVLTATRGELGAGRGDRVANLGEALRILGVTDHRFLGGVDARWPGKAPREYGDSGTGPSDATPGCLTVAAFGEVATDVAAVIENVKPTIVVSYDEAGGSAVSNGTGHPDHIRVHQAARRAAEVMDVPFFTIEATGGEPVDITSVLERKNAALAAHGKPAQTDSVERFARLRPPVEESTALRDQSIITRIAVTIVVLTLSVATGLLMTAVHQSTVLITLPLIGDVLFPWGIIVALVCVTSLLVGIRLVFDTRVLTTIAAVGILGMSAVLAAPTSGGSVVVVANTQGYLWTWVPIVVTLVVLAWPRIHRKAPGKIEHVPAVKGSSIQ
jgi:N-acetyl-1-D-myo-inositol-2-amino-2-deoxy-alpha-D-glucopyranoside deacetylase